MSNSNLVTLQKFNENELIFDEEETKAILSFFFQNYRQRIINTLITTDLQVFAQGLLIAAVDLTYALGYIELLLRSFYNPGAGMQKALTKLGRKAAKHWFKHATQKDLIRAKISSRIRDKFALNFSSVFPMMLDGLAKGTHPSKVHMAHIDISKFSNTDTLWG